VVERLAADIQLAFPGMSGFSPLNVWRMRAFFLAYTGDSAILSQAVTESGPTVRADSSSDSIVQEPNAQMPISKLSAPRGKRRKLSQPVTESLVAPDPTSAPAQSDDAHGLPEPIASLPWGHTLLLLHKLDDRDTRLWYAAQAIEHGWSLNILALQIDSDLHLHHRRGKAATNFSATLPPAQSDVAQQSAQRLKNLMKDYSSAIQPLLSTFIQSTCSISKNPRWGKLAGSAKVNELRKPPAVPRAVAPNIRHPSNLILRLRRILGVGVKADSLALMLATTHAVTTREIAKNLSYTNMSVHRAMRDLSTAMFLSVTPGQPAMYTAPAAGEWQRLLWYDYKPVWKTWHHGYALAIDLMAWVDQMKDRSVSEYAADVKVREVFSRHDVFFQLTAHELSGKARTDSRGSAEGVLASIIGWARQQEKSQG
jgi:hypothetical protein